MGKRNGKGRRTRLILAGAGMLAIFLAAGGIYFLLHAKKTGAAVPAQALSVNAGRGTLSTTIVGSGHLENAEAQKIQVAAGLSIETVAVEAGDTVRAGDVLALVDETALTATIAQMQSVISELDEQINEKTGETESQYVTSKVGGRIKKIYAAAKDEVADVMVEEGALLVLSLDGKMAVQVETEADTSAGAAVSVTLSAGTMVSGTVESCAAGKVTVTLTDDGTVFGDTVTVTDGNGQLLGTGTLCIHQPLEVTGTSGQVSVVHVAENQWVEAGEELLTLADVSVSAEYQELLAVRTVYKEKLKELLSLADGCAVTAPVDGVIESVTLTEGSTTAVSSSGSTATEEDPSSIPAVGMAFSGWTAQSSRSTGCMMKLSTGLTQPAELPDEREADISANQDGSLGQTGDGGEREQDAADDQTSEDGQGQKGQGENEGQGHKQDAGDGGQINQQNEVDEEAQQIAGAQQVTGQGTGLDTGLDTIQTETVQQSTGVSQAQTTAEVLTQEVSGNDAEDPFTMPDIQGLQEQVTGFTIAVQDHMLLSVDIDELDILSVEEGQEVQITMDAAEGKIFTGEVTEVSDSTSGGDGSAKYTVEVTVPKDDLMRVGMSASATIVTEKKEDVVVVPADAVQERGPQIFVYTQYDAASGVLSGETQVETGMSDGEKVEITSGLAEGDTVYYQKIESQPSQGDSQKDQQEGMFQFDMNGGGQPGGDMPGGGRPDGAPAAGHMGGSGGQ